MNKDESGSGNNHTTSGREALASVMIRLSFISSTLAAF